MRKFIPLLILLPLLVGCAGGSVTANYAGATWTGDGARPDEGRVITAQAALIQSESSSTTDFDVTIEQPDAPPAMGRNDTFHLRFVVTVRNRTLEPATIKRLTLQNAGSNFTVDTVTKPFDVTIEPGAESKFELHAKATGIDPTVGTRVPMMIRATIESMQNESRSRASFVRSINGNVTVGVSQ